MPPHQFELIKRLNREVGLAPFLACVETVLAQAAFDEELKLELVLEEDDGRRTEREVLQREIPAQFSPESWVRLHRVLLSNPWIKGMNLKLQWVKRLQSTAVTLKLEMSQPGALKAAEQAMVRALNALDAPAVAGERTADSHEEREELFGAMLLTESVARQAKQPFLIGDFAGCLVSAYAVLTKRMEKLLGAPLKKREDVETVFHQDPPCFLLPDLSGPRLQLEWVALARLWSGLELLLQPVVHGWEKPSGDPGPVLKKLVLISMLVERLEAATANPAAVKKKASRLKVKKQARRPSQARKAAPPASRARKVQKTKRKDARKTR